MRTKNLILTGGILNTLLSLFHIYLCFQIYNLYSGTGIYPLLQMFSVGGSLMIFFLAFTSLVCADEISRTKLGRSIIILNVLVYLTRSIGEVVLFPQPKIMIIVVCLLIAGIYSTIFFKTFKKSIAG